MDAKRGGMVAPCGINCSYCYAHLRERRPCPGCRSGDDGKPKHCLKCKIKACIAAEQVRFCSDCSSYPCTLIKRLDKSYRTRYNESLVTNLRVIHEKGMDYYLDHERVRLQCPACDGVLNIHQKRCSRCGGIFEVGALE